MAYNSYGYPSYGTYFQQQSQQPAQESTTSNNQGYQDRSIPYSPYYQSSNTSYAQQTPNDQQSQYQSTSYQTTPVTDAAGYNHTYYQRQQYQKPSADNVASPYAQSSTYGSVNQGGSNQLSSVDRSISGQYSAGQNTSSTTAYRDMSALGHLAYASTIGRNSPAEPKAKTPAQVHTPTSLSSYSTSMTSAYDAQQRPTSKGKDSTTSQPFKAPAQRSSYQDANTQSHQLNRQLSNPSQFRVNYPAHSRLSSGSESARYSPLQGAAKTGPQTASASVSPMTTSSTIRQQAMKSPPMRANRSPAQNSSKQNQSINKVISFSNAQPSRPERPQARQEPTDTQKTQIYQSAPPTTVDPSQVFDQAEYQRRKVAAEAEAETARRATKEASIKAQEAAQKTQQALQPNPPTPQVQAPTPTQQAAQPSQVASPAPTPKQSPVDSQSREQLQAEMKAMIEKMREYKAKDPAGFTEIWEQLRKFQQPARTSSQTPQIGKASIPSTTDAAASPGLDNAPFQSPLLDTSSPSLNDSNLPDLGKFPAMRRRTRVDKGVKRQIEGLPGNPNEVNPKKPPRTSETPAVINTPPLSAKFSYPHPYSTGPRTTVDDDATGSESMRQAMLAFHNTPTPAPSDASPPPFKPPAQGPSKAAPIAAFKIASKAISPPVTQVSKPTLPQNGTAWPEKEKPKLAAVAKSALQAYPANKGKTIEASEIHGILDGNPSYPQLCQILDDRGFTFDRAEFARTLLAAVPADDTGPSTEQPAEYLAEQPAEHLAEQPAEQPAKKKRGRPKKNGTQTSASEKKGSAPSATLQAQTQAQAQNAGLPVRQEATATTEVPRWHGSVPTSAPQAQLDPKGAQSTEVPRSGQSKSPALKWDEKRMLTPGVSHEKHSNSPNYRFAGAKVANNPAQTAPRAAPEYDSFHNQLKAVKGVFSAVPKPTKQQMAQKRSIGDVIDITQTSDDDGPARKRQVAEELANPATPVNPANGPTSRPIPP